MTHIDDFIDDLKSDAYAAWIFNYFRLPAILHMRFAPFMAQHRLFCTHEGVRSVSSRASSARSRCRADRYGSNRERRSEHDNDDD